MAKISYGFEGISQPIDLIDCAELVPLIKTIAQGWPVEECAAGDPIITIEKTPKGFSRTSPWLSKPAVFSNPVTAVCDFLVDHVKAYINSVSDLLCLHGAAIEIDGGLVLLLSKYRLGKSTLVLQLAARGAVVFADDVIPLEPKANHGLALGLLPRLRLPLPEIGDGRFQDFVRDHSGPENKRYLYVSMGAENLAPFGATAPIKGIVWLQRRRKGKATFQTFTESTVTKATIYRNFSLRVPAIEIFDRVHAITAQADSRVLTYSSGVEAADAVLEAFS